MGGEWAGVIDIVAVTLVGAAVLWPFLNLGTCRRGLLWLGRRSGVLPPAVPEPSGPPIERIVQDLRRIAPQARHVPAGTPMAKRQALWAAYDDALVDACDALGVRTALTSTPEGLERESERLRTEYALERAGVQLAP
jgi:hypothetical protein